MRGRLREPEARVEHDPAWVDAGQHRGVHPRDQLGPHLPEHVLVRREPAHPVAVTAPVHEDPRHPGLRDHPGHRGVGEATGHVVDDRRPGLQNGLGDRGARGVDADRHALGDELAHHRQHPAQLLGGVDPAGARAGGLATDVDQVRARRAHA